MDLLTHEVVVLRSRERLHRLLVLLTHLTLVPLHKAEQRVMPHDGQRPPLVLEPHKVVHKCINDPVREGVLLVEEHADEEAGGAAVVHLGHAKQGGGRVDDGNGGLDG